MIKAALIVVIAVLAVDFLGFVLWIMSAQVPQSNWYIGTITFHIIKLFIK